MNPAAVGFRVHSGWTALVALFLEENEPTVLCRQRVPLVKTFSYKFRQPYHTAGKLPPIRARQFVDRVSKEARGLATRTLRDLQGDLEKDGHRLQQCAILLASGRQLPPLKEILSSHPMIHTADGELFRDALIRASERRGLPVFRVKEKELLAHASETLGVPETLVLRRVTELGHSLGPPWSQDEKFAALAAWLALRGGQKATASKSSVALA